MFLQLLLNGIATGSIHTLITVGFTNFEFMRLRIEESVSYNEKNMEFDAKKTISYWLESAEHDLDVVDAMFRTEKYPYALFIGHLTLEKLLKAGG